MSEIHCRTKRGTRVREAADRSSHSLLPLDVRVRDVALMLRYGVLFWLAASGNPARRCVREQHAAQLPESQLGRLGVHEPVQGCEFPQAMGGNIRSAEAISSYPCIVRTFAACEAGYALLCSIGA